MAKGTQGERLWALDTSIIIHGLKGDCAQCAALLGYIDSEKIPISASVMLLAECVGVDGKTDELDLLLASDRILWVETTREIASAARDMAYALRGTHKKVTKRADAVHVVSAARARAQYIFAHDGDFRYDEIFEGVEIRKCDHIPGQQIMGGLTTGQEPPHEQSPSAPKQKASWP